MENIQLYYKKAVELAVNYIPDLIGAILILLIGL